MAKILVLEDDEHFRGVLIEALKDEGYQVVGCGSGDEAVERARHEEFTLVVADVKMRGMDGLGAVSLIQSLQPEVRSLVVTGYADTIEMARADNLCLDGFLKKPFDLDDLLDQVEKLVEKQVDVGAEVRAEAKRLEWARWINEREGERLGPVGELSSFELLRVAREVCSRVGLSGFEGEQLVSALLWSADSSNAGRTCPEPLQRFIGPEKGLEGEVCSALRSLLGHPPAQTTPAYLLALVEEVKEQEPAELSGSEKALVETARLLFQRGDYSACEKALDQFFLSNAALGRERIRAQTLRAHIYTRSNRTEEAYRTVRRMMESARQDGPLALSEAALAAGFFLLQKEQLSDAVTCYTTAAEACENLGMTLEAELCELVRDLLSVPRLNESFRERVSRLRQPRYQKILTTFRPTLDLVFARWKSSLDGALAEAGERGGFSSVPRIELFTLGRFRVVCHGREIPNTWWRSKKARELFAYLALDSCRLAEETLLEQFWPGDPTKARNNLYTAASYIRAALRKAGLETDPLERAGGSLELSSQISVWHDCQELLVARGAETMAERRRALTLYNGSFLPDCYLEWAERIKRMVDESVLEVSLEVARQALQEGRLSEAVESGRAALSVSPCLDEAHIVVMESLLKQSRFLEVLRHYESLQQTYTLELDAPPPIAVERLYQRARLSS